MHSSAEATEAHFIPQESRFSVRRHRISYGYELKSCGAELKIWVKLDSCGEKWASMASVYELNTQQISLNENFFWKDNYITENMVIISCTPK